MPVKYADWAFLNRDRVLLSGGFIWGSCLFCITCIALNNMLYEVTMEKEKADRMIGIRIPKSVGERLDNLAKRTGRTRTWYIREAIMEHLDDLEDIYLAEQVLERVRRGEEPVTGIDEVERRLGLED